MSTGQYNNTTLRPSKRLTAEVTVQGESGRPQRTRRHADRPPRAAQICTVRKEQLVTAVATLVPVQVR